MPKLSIIVPVYNTEKYLRECIESILAQTFTDFELILVDDGSTDQSGAICDEYAQEDQRTRVIHQKNKGVTYARKVGAVSSEGEYITYVDSDDWIDVDTYRSMFLSIEKHNADIGIFAMVLNKKNPTIIENCVGEGVFSKEMLQKTVYPKMLFDYSLNRSGILASLCNKVIKKELLQNAITAIPDELVYGEDAIAGYLCLLNASTVYICNNTFYNYRYNPTSITNASSFVMKKRFLALDCEMRHQLSGYDVDMSNQIDGHIAKHAVEQVRRDLLSLNEKSLFERCRAAHDFCKQPQISLALKKAYPLIYGKKEKIKVLLIKHRFYGLLYFFFKIVNH